ncbi:UDP-N-acetylglucosamine 2-epimerase (non-hydrolyzing) [Sphingorhabdus sp. IMCC26285]|jgi:UDP-N-acetylglucosamine 2-epimerase (non-hydrolysing)|uniref:UDP-N-acetylglucosamine 2-epimerase (non-hydrolyzing) n=1 Tax=Sphingorhabdus profundilacus TaxID=2509718 RepID=A0A6I4LUZ4_9SPHN|nr:UDP-N-acetylglucosamine 2-epimerase (non-hydrolyzing) [Sphingorhabdus profundilacus]MVZ97317.1 UDP-N-acetylglucosamine 2-epimerase (non-hydrolyzing) [Sphingorhabdus profundilacus]
MYKNMVIFGTRPEAIKLFPVINALKQQGKMLCEVLVTAQHREMLDQVLHITGITPDHDLNIMQHGQSLDALTARLLEGIGHILDSAKPDRVLVQGDTATAMVGALAAYYRQIPVSHIEAGLRSYDIYRPWPEEVNRKIIGSIADQHFAPTNVSASALKAEAVPDDRVFVTGNTVIDALYWITDRISHRPEMVANLAGLEARFEGKKIIGITTHRRENFGDGMENIALAIKAIAARDDVACIFPVHLNPNVRGVMERMLGTEPNVAMIEPLDYPNFARLLSISHILLTDSGGVQEEAPALGKPVLVMRDTTERPEGVTAGTAKLIGTDKNRIISEIFTLLDDDAAYSAMARAHNPFGDGKASQRIAEIIWNASRQKT